MNTKSLTKMLNTLPGLNFAGYKQSVFVYADDATTLLHHILWRDSSKGLRIYSRKSGQTALITGWLDALGLAYTVEVDTFRHIKIVTVK